ncbi:(2,3-dihydroxybenzoyl)adenylate synthase [Actinomadura harenae]|uniref:(2,3-dihydroxybenzoyl)adenylate synthase n=1 Tax=Actinomadura harenae TaxID=2483351 RepID=A0A3M2LV18_9ACTN|nr:AMP-binding protein [Actinomadura harenae]RMI40750.1 (2,3-dihydroxybenzoyl)adenylate synthase [Actinomadura harenae]
MRHPIVPWPSDAAATYREAGCWRGRPLGAFLWDAADRHPTRTALVDGGTRLTHLDVAERADRLAEGLAGLGLERGDGVLVQLPNSWEFVVVTMACFRLGLVPVMMLLPHREYELTSIAEHVGARALLVPSRWRDFDHEALAHRVAARVPSRPRVLTTGEPARPDSVALRPLMEGRDESAEGRGGVAERRARLDARAPSPSGPALFLLSGGTTGLPKLISRTHDDYAYNIRRVSAVCGLDAETVYLAVLPAGHNFPLANPGILGTLMAGGRVVLLPSPRPAAVFAAVEAERVTVTAATPAIALRWTEEAPDSGRDLSSLLFVQVGGSMLSPEVAARIGPALGCRLQQMYGMAEGLICCLPYDMLDDEAARATQGPPISPYDELKVVGRDGTPVPPGGVGELLTRGPYTPRGYYAAPEQNAVSFTADGWYRTGDLVRITPEGRVVVCGRVKDLINRGGEKIAPGEVEVLVQEIPAVAEAAVLGLPDPVLGERVCLVVRVHPGRSLTLTGVRAALTARGIAAFKHPDRLVVLADLPHTPLGKPDKNALRALLDQGTAA